MKKVSKIILSGIAVSALFISQNIQAGQEVTAAFPLAMQVNAVVDESGCDNSPGPQITVGGTIKLGGVDACVLFKNNVKGTHTATIETQYDVALVLDGSCIVIPKQPVRGGVGGNPHIYLQFHDGKGCDLSEEFYLGRCVQGFQVNASLLNEAVARAEVVAGDCSHKGPTVTLAGDITLSGLHAKIIFRNNVKGTHTAEDVRDVTLLLDGTCITVPKQPCRGGAGGNPLISLQFMHLGQPVIDPVFLGRCNRL